MAQVATREKWRALIRRQGESGETVREFCGANGVSTASFYVWKRKLREDDGQRWPCDLVQATGKRRLPVADRFAADHLLLFEIGDFESLIEKQQQEARPRRKKKRNGRRLLPDHLPREEVLHELPETERLCPIDGQPRQPIRRGLTMRWR